MQSLGHVAAQGIIMVHLSIAEFAKYHCSRAKMLAFFFFLLENCWKVKRLDSASLALEASPVATPRLPRLLAGLHTVASSPVPT